MLQLSTHTTAERDDTPVGAPARMFGALLKVLSDLDRRGFQPQVCPLRNRLRAAVREGSLEEIYMEVAAVRDAADALEHRA